MQENSSQSSSFLPDAPNQYKESEKEPQQFKALFIKNMRLQSKQVGTNLCQILTPILCIIFTYLMKTLAEDNMPVGAIFDPLYYPFKFNDYEMFDDLNNDTRNHLKWFTYECGPKCDEDMLGVNNGEEQRGLLGKINFENQSTLFHPNVMEYPDEVYNMSTPFFLKANESSVNKMLYHRLGVISSTNITVIKEEGGLDYLPDGAYNIQVLNSDEISFDAKVNDVRDLEMHRSNGASKIEYFQKLKKKKGDIAFAKDYNSYAGIMEVTHMMTEAFVQLNANKTIESGYMTMPEDQNSVTFVDTVISVIAILIFPISLSLLFPVFLYTVVLEKEEKLIQMMKMNGMKISSYWIVYFIFNLLLSIITNVVFMVLGYLMTGMRFFVETDTFLFILVLLGWSLAQIGMAVFFQTFLSKSRSANIIGYLISIWTSMIGSTLSIGVYMYPMEMPYGLRMFAPFGFVRLIYLMLTTCSQGRCFGDISYITDQMKDCLLYLYLNFIFFFLLGTYLFQIVPQEFGVTRSPLFPFTMIVKKIKKCISGSEEKAEESQFGIEDDDELKQYIGKDEEDAFSKKERSDMFSEKNLIENNPLVINNLRKLYKKEGREGMYPAVRSFNLKVGPRETFGLLGPNGAGKTTLISMITGMFEPNNGNAWIGGFDIKSSVEKAQLQMGVCPQFDLLWPQLTVEEHLYFYARLKGVPSSHIKNKVEGALKDVKLTKFKSFQSSSLSGGMKRRLSVAISLVGDPQIVFLDEPSTGLDPENRRQLWDVLAKCQKNRAIFITTHMMEEADALCNRIGIITSGVLRTVGPQTSLKKIYGGGYRLTISTAKEEKKLIDRNSIHMLDGDGDMDEINPNYSPMKDPMARKSIDSFVLAQQREQKMKTQKRVEEVNAFMNKSFSGTVLEKQFNGYLIFKVPLKYKVSQIFEIMEKMQKELDIVDVAITTSSLEDVFMNVVKEYELNAKDKRVLVAEENEQFLSFPSENFQTNDQKSSSNVKKSVNDPYGSIVSKKRESIMSDGEPNHHERNQNQEKANKEGEEKSENDDGDYF